ncbi:acetylornithine transaminase [Streptomyces clavuligerus]|uniref:Acetylornithine aminotransferase n=1 Tax=Streptomyces clavuligerus TaxID=1901 RepID=B5H254_STRCL|nr:acetylornithine transaminase [Streptomyces clavuligerus]ANW21045.1 acetylornithine aminotransferase [Streptomyces clavuligerus]AXU15664.1 acetylornithine transaminase [Streptomyces clavuligerus]EDY52650.1 acetylornithine aminotransferase [Streptomyces clavuligerus]EFG05875.1 Acetylornithine aminotransferase [Streptomyces clavuligerus]MBY6305783.1 acetylornithine transaminase [Streptomyces clavuligerus]
MSNQEFAQRWQGVMIDSYGTPGLSFVRGEGSTLWDADGTAYTDFVSGLAVNALGHAHPAVVGAVSRQIASLGHISNFYSAEPTITLAERLIELFGRPGRVFFCNSGAEANETAFKIGRLTGRSRIVAAQSGFHGRTMGSLALTGQPAKREPFLPLPGDVTHVPYGDAEALRAAVTEDTAMVILEPIQGESGVVVPPKGYLRAAREITEATGTLLVLDEVQTGIGRTGHWFAAQAEGVEADVVTLAKGLGGGLPLGAAVAFGRAAELMTPGHHASTFGGNPVSCAAGLAVLDTIAADGLLDRVKQLGERLRDGVERCGDGGGHPLVSHVRGAGLMLGIVLNEPLAPQVQLAAQKAGFLVNVPAPDVVRLIPPLVIEETEVDAFLQALPGLLDAVHERDREGQTGE